MRIFLKPNKFSINNLKYSLTIFALVLIGFVIIFSCGVVSVAAANASTIYVNGSSGNDSWTGLNATYIGGINGPKATIKNGTGTVNNGGTIYVAQGTYYENNITINTNISIIGENQQNTIINGTNTGTIFLISSGVNVTIGNITLTNGNLTNFCGGAIINNGSLNVNNSNLENNIGSAINNNGNLIVNNSKFNNNIANEGNSIVNSLYCNSTVINCIFINNGNNTATMGAICNGGIFTVTGSTFINNTANIGGALENAYSPDYNCSMMVLNCNFIGNTANTVGGAVLNDGGILYVNNSDFINDTSEYGGAIMNFGILNLTCCNFNNNNASDQGGALVNGNVSYVSYNNFTNNYSILGGTILNCCTLYADSNNFTNNTASEGGAIFNAIGVIANTTSSAIINFNELVGNYAVNGSDIYNIGGVVNASLNWWGSNNNPSNLVYGTVDYSNWLYMTETVNPTTLINGSIATVTVSFNNIYNGTNVNVINPANGNIPDGTVVNFNSILGTFSPTTTVTSRGIATTIFMATNIGSDFINATTNNQTVSAGTTVSIPLPKAGFSTNTTSGADPLNVQFKDTSLNSPTSWLWDFGDGGCSTLQNPIYTYTTPGKYTVTLTATNSYGNNTVNVNNLIDVIGSVEDITTGLTYNNITAAVNDINTNNNDIITVAAGNYTENVVINKTLRLEALGAVNITQLDATQPVFTINSNGSGSTIEGFTISGSDNSGIYINNATGNTITNDTILGNGTMTWGICIVNSNGSNSMNNNVVNNCTEGINLYNVDGATITNNAARDNEYDGIALTNSDDNTIINNNGTTQNVSGIRLNSSNDNTVSSNDLTGNIWTSISLVTSQFNQITNNTVSSDQEGMYLYSSDNNTVSGNTADNNTWDGIAVADSNNNVIQNNDNVTDDNSGIRIIGTSSGNQVLNNVVSGNVWADMSLDTAGNTTISDNTFTNSEEGIFIYNSNDNTVTNNIMNNNIWDGSYIGNSDNNTLTGNSMSNGGYGVRIQGSTGNSIIANNFVNNYNQANDDGSNEIWNNSTTGNYYNDWNTTNPRPVGGGSNIDEYPSTTAY